MKQLGVLIQIFAQCHGFTRNIVKQTFHSVSRMRYSAGCICFWSLRQRLNGRLDMPRCGRPLGIPKLRNCHIYCLLKTLIPSGDNFPFNELPAYALFDKAVVDCIWKIFLEIALFSGGFVERFDEVIDLEPFAPVDMVFHLSPNIPWAPIVCVGPFA